jgi:hypothetical protein
VADFELWFSSTSGQSMLVKLNTTPEGVKVHSTTSTCKYMVAVYVCTLSDKDWVKLKIWDPKLLENFLVAFQPNSLILKEKELKTTSYKHACSYGINDDKKKKNLLQMTSNIFIYHIFSLCIPAPRRLKNKVNKNRYGMVKIYRVLWCDLFILTPTGTSGLADSIETPPIYKQ